MRRTEDRAWLSHNVKVLSGVSFLQDAASELLYPILPIFIRGVLHAPVAIVGLIEGVAEGAASVAKFVSGRLGDRFRKRPMIAAGYGMAALGKALIAVAFVWPVVLAGRVTDRLGKGIRGAPRDALLVAGVPKQQRGRLFGFHRSADTAGAVVGPLIGLGGYELLHHHIRPLLVVAVVPAVLSVALVRAVHEDPPSPRDGQAAAPPPLVPLRQLPAHFWRVVGMLTVFSLVNFPDALLILRLRALHFSVVTVILAYVTYNAVYAGLSLPAGTLADRYPERRVFGVGLVFFAVGYLGLGLTHSRVVAWVLLAVYGGFTAFTDGVGKSWISGLVGDRSQSSAQGAFQGFTGAAVVVAGVWAGLAWHGTGVIPLVISGCVAAVMAVFLLTSRSTGGPIVP